MSKAITPVLCCTMLGLFTLRELHADEPIVMDPEYVSETYSGDDIISTTVYSGGSNSSATVTHSGGSGNNSAQQGSTGPGNDGKGCFGIADGGQGPNPPTGVTEKYTVELSSDCDGYYMQQVTVQVTFADDTQASTTFCEAQNVSSGNDTINDLCGGVTASSSTHGVVTAYTVMISSTFVSGASVPSSVFTNPPSGDGTVTFNSSVSGYQLTVSTGGFSSVSGFQSTTFDQGAPAEAMSRAYTATRNSDGSWNPPTAKNITPAYGTRGC